MTPMPLYPLRVSVRPSASKDSSHGAPVANRAVSRPLVNESPVTRGTVGAACTAKRGCLGRSPAKCVIVTRITSGAGDVQVTVMTGALSVSSRPRTCLVAAYTVSRSVPATASCTCAGCSTVIPSRLRQNPSVNFIAGRAFPSWLRSLDRSGGDAAGQGALEDQEERDGGQDPDECRRAGRGGVHHAVALQHAECHRDGLLVVGDEEDQRQQEL